MIKFRHTRLATLMKGTKIGLLAIKKDFFWQKQILTMLLVCLGFFVNAQNNLNVMYYDMGYSGSSGGGSGGGGGLDVTTLDAVFGTVTVNGVVRTADVKDSDRNISELPTNVSNYNGIQMIYLIGFGKTGSNYTTVTSISKAQADALIAYVKGGGILLGSMEGITVQTVNKDFNKYVGEALLLQSGVTISAAPADGSIPSTAVAYHNNGGVLYLNDAATSVGTTSTSSSFTGVPRESAIFSLAKPASTAQCSTVSVLDFIAPSYPGDYLAKSSGILGFAYLSAESNGGLNSRIHRNDSQANINLANMIYDYLYNPSTMVTRRAWSKTAANVNSFCPVSSTSVECTAGTTAPSLSGTSISNTCPATTANLNSLHNGTTPSGASLVWFTNSTHIGAAYATPTAATAGTYYAFYYDSATNCYSPASAAVTVTINFCAATPVPTGTNPTTPGASNGSVSLSPATGSYPANTPVSVTYTNPSGTTVTYTGTSNGSGQIVIPNLPAGTYNNFTVAVNGGPASSPSGPVTLTDPAPACAADAGIIIRQ